MVALTPDVDSQGDPRESGEHQEAAHENKELLTMADYEDTEPEDYTGATECQLRLPIAHESQSTTLHLTNGGLHVEGERKGFPSARDGRSGQSLVEPTLGPARTGSLPLPNSAGPCGRIAG